MRAAHIGRLLLALGVLVGIAASVGLLVGFEPARLPPALLNLAAYKLTFIAALGLLAGRATFVRFARRADGDESGGLAPASSSDERGAPAAGALPPGAPAVDPRTRHAATNPVVERGRGAESP